MTCAIAVSQGCSDASNFARLARKYAACDGRSLDRSAAIAFATAGIVAGEYHRCGFGVLSGSPSRCWTTMTLRTLFGAAPSILSM